MRQGSGIKRVLAGGMALLGMLALSSCAKNNSPASPFATYNPPDNYLEEWGSKGNGNGKLSYPQGIAVNNAGTTVYVADTFNERIEVFDGNGNYLFQWGGQGKGPGQLGDPMGLALNSAGTTIYEADSNNGRIQYFSATGTYLGQWAALGPLNYIYPYSVAVNSAGTTVYVTNPAYADFEIFSGTGSFLGGSNQYWTLPGSFSSLSGLAVNSSGTTIYVGLGEGNGIEAMDPSGNLLQTWFSSQSNGDLVGLAMDPTNTKLYAVNSNYSEPSVEILNGLGAIVGGYGTYGVAPGYFEDPAFIAVDGAGYQYVTDSLNCRVLKFKP